MARTSEEELLVCVLGVQLNSVGDGGGSDVVEVLVVGRLVVLGDVDASGGGHLFLVDDLEVSVSGRDHHVELD